MKRTPFYDIHISLGAKMVPFAGFEMPVQYSSILEEHRAVRNSVGVFDVSHMGEIEVSGPDALSTLQKVTINDVAKLFPGRIHYSAMCYEHGGIIDDLLVYQIEKKSYLLVVNAANIEKDFQWLHMHTQGDVTIVNRSDAYAMLAVQGPRSFDTLQKLTEVNLSSIAYYHFVQGTLAGVPMLISRTGYTGEVGFELYFPAESTIAKKVWDALFEAGREFDIVPVGLGARDTLRLEMGYCLYGNDIDETTNPLEAGLGWITKFNKHDFIGKKALKEVQEQGITRKLVGFTLPDKRIARHGYSLIQGETRVGYVTSGGFSPTLEKSIGMGYITTRALERGDQLSVEIRQERLPITLTQVPFLHK